MMMSLFSLTLFRKTSFGKSSSQVFTHVKWARYCKPKETMYMYEIKLIIWITVAYCRLDIDWRFIVSSWVTNDQVLDTVIFKENTNLETEEKLDRT